jgi:hypothetical protein
MLRGRAWTKGLCHADRACRVRSIDKKAISIFQAIINLTTIYILCQLYAFYYTFCCEYGRRPQLICSRELLALIEQDDHRQRGKFGAISKDE